MNVFWRRSVCRLYRFAQGPAAALRCSDKWRAALMPASRGDIALTTNLDVTPLSPQRVSGMGRGRRRRGFRVRGRGPQIWGRNWGETQITLIANKLIDMRWNENVSVALPTGVKTHNLLYWHHQTSLAPDFFVSF